MHIDKRSFLQQLYAPSITLPQNSENLWNNKMNILKISSTSLVNRHTQFDFLLPNGLLVYGYELNLTIQYVLE